MKEIECRITGRVQLVMYRDFAQRRARAKQLVGSVQNLSDGSVRVIAQGDEAVLKDYIELLKKGSILSRVDTVEVTWRDLSVNYTNFSIIFK